MGSGGCGDAIISDFLADADPGPVLDFVAARVTGDADAARELVSDHASGEGTTLVARIAGRVLGVVTVRWTSKNTAYAERGIPLVHQIAVAPEHRRSGVATALMDAAEGGCLCIWGTVDLR